MLVFEERGKPEFPEKNLSEQSREPTNSAHIWRRVRESNPGHIGGRRALSPLHQPCSPMLSRGLPCVNALTDSFTQRSWRIRNWTISELKMSSENIFWGKTSVATFKSFDETVENTTKEAIKVQINDVKITWVSNYMYPITKSSNQVPVFAHPRDRADNQSSSRNLL